MKLKVTLYNKRVLDARFRRRVWIKLYEEINYDFNRWSHAIKYFLHILLN